MQITTKFDTGSEVFRKSNNKWIAHIVSSITITVQNHKPYITYNLTRNLNSKYPSGGDLPNALESILYSEPIKRLTRREVYEEIHTHHYTEYIMSPGSVSADTIDTARRLATQLAVRDTDYYFYNQSELKELLCI